MYWSIETPRGKIDILCFKIPRESVKVSSRRRQHTSTSLLASVLVVSAASAPDFCRGEYFISSIQTLTWLTSLWWAETSDVVTDLLFLALWWVLRSLVWVLAHYRRPPAASDSSVGLNHQEGLNVTNPARSLVWSLPTSPSFTTSF